MIDKILHLLWEGLGLLAVSSAYIWEVWNDWNGDAHISRAWFSKLLKISSKKVDIAFRVTLFIGGGLVVWVMGLSSIIAGIAEGIAIFFAFFDYTITFILIKRGIIAPTAKWYDYLSSGGFDNIEQWRKKAWYIRMAIRIAVFVIVCIIYF